MKFWIILITFLLGVGLGLSLPSLAPQYLDSFFPKIMKPSTQEVKGAVVKKQNNPNRLLITISSKDGAILATFRKKITEISLLVEEGDRVTLALKEYAPFVTDPKILRVKKPEVDTPSPTTPEDGSLEPVNPGPIVEPDSILEGSPATSSEHPDPDHSSP